MTPSSSQPGVPIGETLRRRRVDILGKSLRETAKLLDIAPAHLTDIEKGRRNPSEELLLRVVQIYGIDEATLRSGWGRAETVVGEIASRTPTTAAKAPELLRAANDLAPDQWDALIQQAKAMASKVKKKTPRKSR